MLGRGIPAVTLGKGEKSVLYVGGQQGGASITTWLLLRMLEEYCELYRSKGLWGSYSVPYLFSTRTLYVIPMLNPDGIEYCLHGVQADHILRERLLAMNHESEDFSDWQANARGVELTKNYPYRFANGKQIESESDVGLGAPSGYSGQYPESEPEIGHLCNYIRFHSDIKILMELCTGQEKIVYMPQVGKNDHRMHTAQVLARNGGDLPYSAQLEDEYGTLLGWCEEELALSGFRLECGKGTRRDAFPFYTRIRNMLISAATMI